MRFAGEAELLDLLRLRVLDVANPPFLFGAKYLDEGGGVGRRGVGG